MGTLPLSRIMEGVTSRGIILAGFVAVAMVLGGGGSPSPASEMAVQLAFAMASILWVWWPSRASARGIVPPKSLLVGGLALLALPAWQLVPWPPSVWQELPSRDLAQATLSLIGESENWRPVSISPPLTLAALLALIPAIGAMWAAALLGSRERRFLLFVIVVVALSATMLGAMQMASGPDDLRLYEKSHRGWLTAFHANRNAAADSLLIGSLAFSAWFTKANVGGAPRLWLPFAAGQSVLLIAILLTGSRAGIALIFVTLPFHWLMLRPANAAPGKRPLLMVIAGFAFALAALPLILSGNSRIARVVARFDATSDARIPLWRDTLEALDAFWPAGSGIGTFPNALQPFENVVTLNQFFPNRAHNDYLEFLLEAGVLAIPVLLGGAILLVKQARKAWKLSPKEHSCQLFALGTLAIVALHSVVDYPLRNMAIACLAGVAAGLLTVVPSPGKVRAGDKGREET